MNKKNDNQNDEISLLKQKIIGLNKYISELEKIRNENEFNKLKLEDAMELANMVYWEVDLRNNCFIFNDQLYSLYGTTAEAEGGYTMSLDEYATRFIHPDQINDFYETVKNTNAAKTPATSTTFEHKILRGDGKERYILNQTKIIKDNTGKIQRIYGANQDITWRKEIETKLEEEKNRFFALSESAAFGIQMSDNEGKFLYFNPKFIKITGYTLKDIPDETTWFNTAYPDPEYRKMVFSKYVKDMSGGQPGEKTTRTFHVICKDGIKRIFKFIPVILANGNKIVTSDDITEQINMEEKLLMMSTVDDLTGLYNRRGFFTLAEQHIKIAKRSKKIIYFFFCDMDNMKKINDKFGHGEGDIAIQAVGRAIKTSFRESDIIGRIGGDEFVVLAVDSSVEITKIFARRLKTRLAEEKKRMKHDYSLSVSIGTAFFDPENPESIDKLLASADTHMYNMKKRKKD